jgi:hypothetical protein
MEGVGELKTEYRYLGVLCSRDCALAGVSAGIARRLHACAFLSTRADCELYFSVGKFWRGSMIQCTSGTTLHDLPPASSWGTILTEKKE